MMHKPTAEEVFYEAIITGDTGAAIMHQEARGQASFVANEVLPKQGTIEAHMGDGPYRRELEALGFRFTDETDDLFIRCALPAGWRKERTDHSMWSKLFDGQGRERAMIFYKAAFYDRSAHMFFTRRYKVCDNRLWDSVEDGRVRVVQVVVEDAASGAVLFSLPEREHYDQLPREEWPAYFQQHDADIAVARSWLVEHYPDHADPFAYWG